MTSSRWGPSPGPTSAASRPSIRTILAGKRQKGYYERLKDIAPTVALDEKVDWKANLRQDGEALGRPEFAERLYPLRP